MLLSHPVPSSMPIPRDSAKQPCHDISVALATYVLANGPLSPQLNNCIEDSPYYPGIRPAARLLPWTWLNNHVLEYQHGVSHICPSLALQLALCGSNQAAYPILTITAWMVVFHTLSSSLRGWLLVKGKGRQKSAAKFKQHGI